MNGESRDVRRQTSGVRRDIFYLLYIKAEQRIFHLFNPYAALTIHDSRFFYRKDAENAKFRKVDILLHPFTIDDSRLTPDVSRLTKALLSIRKTNHHRLIIIS